MIEFDTRGGAQSTGITLKVLGVGGAGTNMVNSMIRAQIEGIEYVAANTDNQSLKTSLAQHKIQLGAKTIKGLGCGANPELGRRSAEEDIDKIMQIAQSADVLFLVGGMGGGTGSGALPIVAHALRNLDILTICLVTKPFAFEGKRRMNVALRALEQLQDAVDTLIVIPNQKLLDVADATVSMIDAFEMINSLLVQSVKNIADIINRPGLINVDFADLKTIMKDRGKAVMATGRASGPHRATDAALAAISSPLLENVTIDGARGLLLNVSGSSSLKIHEISAAASMIHEAVHEDANIILGSVIDESLQDDLTVTVIATGFDREPSKHDLAQEVATAQSVVTSQPAVKAQHVPIVEKVRMQYQESLQKQQTNLAPMNDSSVHDRLINVNSAVLGVQEEDLDAPTFLRKNKQQIAE